MPKTPSYKLFDLIKSLSGSEKRYFKLSVSTGNANKESKYIQLFDAIDSQDKYDDEALKKKIYVDEPIKSRKYSELKSYLYDLILKSLQGYDEKSSVDFQLKNMLQSIRVLYKRSHYEDCKELIQKTKKLAYKYESFISIIELLQWQKQVAYAQTDIAFLDKELDNINEEENHCLDQVRNVSDYRNILFRVLISTRKDALLRSEEKIANLKKIVEHPLLENISLAKSHQAQILYHHIYGLDYYSVLEYEQFYNSSLQFLTLMESKSFLLKEDVSDYISALSNYILSCGLLEKYDEVRNSLNKFLKIKANTIDDEIRIHKQYYTIKFSLCIFTGAFEEGLVALEEHQEKMKKFDAETFESSQFYFQYFYIYFGVGNYDEALEYLNKWLNLPKSIDRQDLQSLVRVLNLIIHYERGNTMLLEYLFRSTYRFLRKRNRMYEFERKVLSFIRGSDRIRTSKELKEAFINLKTDFENLSQIPKESAMLRYFDFIAWLESKISSRPFAEVVKEQNSKQSEEK